MQIRRHDIFWAKVRFRQSEDRRPWIALDDPRPDPEDPKKQAVLAAPISSQMDLYDSSSHFPIDESDSDFSGTGLSRSSYVIPDHPAWISLDSIGRKCGRLSGDFLKRFKEWKKTV